MQQTRRVSMSERQRTWRRRLIVTGAVVAGFCVQRVLWVRQAARAPAREAPVRRIDTRAPALSDLRVKMQARETVAGNTSRARSGQQEARFVSPHLA